MQFGVVEEFRANQWTAQMTLKRIHREIADVKKEDLGPITLGPTEDSLFVWKGSIPGPKGSCYEGGVFKVNINLAPDYPCALIQVIICMP